MKQHEEVVVTEAMQAEAAGERIEYSDASVRAKCIECGAVLGKCGPVCETCLRAGLVSRVASEVLAIFGPHVQHRERMLDRLVEICRETWAHAKDRAGAAAPSFFLLLLLLFPGAAWSQGERVRNVEPGGRDRAGIVLSLDKACARSEESRVTRFPATWTGPLVCPDFFALYPHEADSRRVDVRGAGDSVAVSDAPAENRIAQRPRVFRSKQFWFDTAIVFLAAFADAKTTVSSQRRCPFPHCEESNPLYGRNPSAGRVYGTALSLAAARRVLVWAVWRKSEKPGRILSALDSIGSGVAHGTAAAANARLPRVCPAAGAGCAEVQR